MPNPVPQYDYICVYDRTTGHTNGSFDPNAFNTNGLAILKPSKCEIIENLNGSYSVTLTHPTDKENLWKNIYVLNFLKVQGQLFRIQSIDTNFDGSSSGSVTAYAEHVMYLQNDAWIFKKDFWYNENIVSGHNMLELLTSIWENSVPNGLQNGKQEKDVENFFPRFYFNSDVEIPDTVYDENLNTYIAEIGEGKTRYEMIMDAVNRFGGELYRNNFYYSIKNRMENAIDNAFDIRVGSNLLGIKRNVDTSKFCTYIRGFFELQDFESLFSYFYTTPTGIGLLNPIVRAKKYSYPDDGSETHSVAESLLGKDVSSYFSHNANPQLKYTIKMKDVRRNPDFQLLSGIRFKVGDTGRIKDTRLGIDETLKVVQTKTNGITGEVEEITLDSSYDFDWGYGHANLPKFPEIPDVPEVSDKIIVWEIGSSLKNYFDDLYTARQFMESNLSALYAVEIGENAGVSTIGNSFSGLANLAQIQIPESVSNTGDNAFSSCTALQTVRFLGDDTAIGISAFENCSALQNINLPQNLVQIGTRAFQKCTSLQQISLPEGLLEIGSYAFRYSGLQNISIPDSVIYLRGDFAFDSCENLQSAEIGAGVSSFPRYCFSNCPSLTQVSFAGNPSDIGHAMFANCGNLAGIRIPDSVQTIGSSAFSNCTAMKSFSCPKNLESIRDRAFSGCTLLREFSFSDSVKAVYQYAFLDCSSLVKIKIPENITVFSIPATNGYYPVFSGCTSLIQISVSNRPMFLAGDPWGAPNFVSTAYAYQEAEKGNPIPEGKHVAEWKGAGGISNLAEKILITRLDGNGRTVSYSTQGGFSGMRSFLQENSDKTYTVSIGSSFNSDKMFDSDVIPADCFSGLTNVKNISIPERFDTIEANAFAGCTELEYLEVAHPKGTVSGEPWGAPSRAAIYYAANLITVNGDTLTADGFLTARTTGNNSEFNTGLSGIIRTETEPETPVEKTLYILNKNNTFSLKLGTKELSL